jgi:hypothetical protein
MNALLSGRRGPFSETMQQAEGSFSGGHGPLSGQVDAMLRNATSSAVVGTWSWTVRYMDGGFQGWLISSCIQ